MRPNRIAALALTAALATGGTAVGVATAGRASAVPVAAVATHGPDPSASSITTNGTYTYATAKVARTLGFGGGTLYYPTNGAPGERFAGVVTMPGFMEPGSVMQLFGTRLASHGFVVLVADPVTVLDQPSARARQVTKAVAALRAAAPVAEVLDGERIGLIGHSMGGGGVLEAAQTQTLQAVVAVHPWDQQVPAMSAVTEPTLVIGGGLDSIAPIGQHAVPMYRTIGSPDKALLVRTAGTHFAGLTDDALIQGRVVSFLKRTLDEDQRYTALFCAPGSAAATFTSSTCG